MGRGSQVVCMPQDKDELEARRDQETGRYGTTLSEDTFAKALAESDASTTSGVAEEVGVAYRTAYKYLRALEDNDRVTRRMVGPTIEWSLAEDEENGDED